MKGRMLGRRPLAKERIVIPVWHIAQLKNIVHGDLLPLRQRIAAAGFGKAKLIDGTEPIFVVLICRLFHQFQNRQFT